MSFGCLCGRVQPRTDHEVLIGIEHAVLQIDQIKERLCFLVKDFFISRFKGRGEILIILRGAVGDGLTKQIGQIIQIILVNRSHVGIGIFKQIDLLAGLCYMNGLCCHLALPW